MTNQSSLEEITFSVLDKYGVSLAEYYVMCTVGYEQFLPLEKLAQVSFDEAQGDPRGEVDISEHLNAIYGCVEKGWFEILSPEKCEREMLRQKSVLDEEDIYFLAPGDVSFTPDGYRMHKQMILEIFGEEHARQMSFIGM